MADPWDPRAPQTGFQAPDLQLLDEASKPMRLSQLARIGPLLVVFFGDPTDDVSRALLRDYRDQTLVLKLAGVRVFAVGRADPSALSFLRMEMGLGFPLLADPDGTQSARFGMERQAGIFLLDRDLCVRQRGLAGRSSPAALLQFIRRGGVKAHKVPLTDRVVHFFKALQAALKPRRPQPH